MAKNKRNARTAQKMKKMPTTYELIKKVRGEPIPAAKKILSAKDRANTRQARKAETRKEIQNY